MKKLFTFLCAALISVGMMAAVTPKGTDAWDDATKTLTVNGNPASNAYIGVSDIENLVISDAVTSIGDNAFENCNGLKSVSFGSSLASIGKEAFASCIKLESVTFPASLQSIGKSAFMQCDALTSVTITNGLTSIGQQAFFNCEKLATVTIPNSVASIGMNAFGNCDGLTEIVVAAENPNYSSADGVLFDKAKTTLLQCPGGKQGEYTIPNSVTSIGNNAFASCFLLTSVEIPNSVGEIGVQAFSSCIELTSVTIGNGVKSIGGYAFYYSSKLASVTINATTPPTLGGSALDKTAAALTIYVPAASVDDYKSKWTAYADKIEAIAGGASAITVTWNSYDLPSSGSSFTKDGVTLTCDIDDSDLYGPGAFTTDLGNFTQIVVSAYDACYIEATGGWSGNTDQKTWTGNAASVSWDGSIYGFSSDVTIVFTIEESAPEPQPAEVTVVFAANDKTAERTVTLPHTFKCDWAGGMERPDELDIIIHELYNDYFYCNSNMNASGSDQVEVGTEEDPKNDYITIKGVFEGTATVTGDYLDYIAGDYGEHNYSITISIKGSEPEPTGVENVQTNPVQATKFFRDGMLLIEKNGKIYNVQGVEVR